MTYKLIFKETVNVIKKNIGVILALFLMMYVPVSLLNSFAAINLDNSAEIASIAQEFTREGITEDEKSTYSAMYVDETSKFCLYLLVVLAVSILAAAFSMAVIKLSADSSAECELGRDCQKDDNEIVVNAEYIDSNGVYVTNDEKRDAQYYFSEAVRCLPRYILAVLFSSLMILLGMFFFVVPGLIAMVISTLIPYTVALTMFRGKAAFSLSATVIAKTPKILVLMATSMLTDSLLSEAAVFLFNKLNIQNVYAKFAVFTGFNCVVALLSVFFTVAMAVAFSCTIKNSPVLKEIVEVGNKFEMSKKREKDN